MDIIHTLGTIVIIFIIMLGINYFFEHYDNSDD